MARKLDFMLGNRPFTFEIQKLDRAKLYGSREIKPVDAGGQPLEKGYLDEWGSVIISASGMGYLGPDRTWHSKAELVAVDAEGNLMAQLPSSFDGPVNLTRLVSHEEYCQYEISTVYILRGLEEAVFAELIQADGLYAFPFVYRAGYEARTAFLNPVGDQVFMAIGTRAELEFLHKNQTTFLEDESDEADEDGDDDDDLDFSMM